MATIKAVIRRAKRDALGTCPVWIRISDGDSSRYISTGERVKPANWNPRKREVRATDPHYEEKNGVIRQKLEEVELERLRIVLEDDAPPTPDRIKKAAAGDDTVPDFFAFAEAHLEELTERGNIARARQLRSTVGKLEEFAGKPLRFDRITPRLLADYETDCLTRLENKPSTVENNMKSIRAIIGRAVDHRVIPAEMNPFGRGGFKITRGETADRTRLSFAEIKAIENLMLEPGSLAWHVRNLWLFQFYAGGLRFGDALQMTAGRIVAGTGGAPDRLAFRAGKTGKVQSAVITPPARRILEMYLKDDAAPDDFIFPLLRGYTLTTPKQVLNAVASRTTVANRALKEIGKAAGITRPITTHVARHSMADLARKEGWSLYDVSKLLGHSTIRQTETYLSSFDADSIDEGLTRMFGEVEG